LTIFSMSASDRPPEAWMRDLLLLAGALVLGVHVDTMPLASMSKVTSICGTPRGAGGMPFQVELAQHLVVGGHLALALEHADGHRVLVVLGRREHLALLGRDRGVAVDQAGEHAAQRLDAERQRRHVEQQHVLDVALEHAGLDGRAHGHDFVGVDALVRLLAEELPSPSSHLGHAGHAADQNDLVDLASLTPASLRAALQGSIVRCTRSGRPGFRAWRG
jgi:hypothetical protein